MSTETTMTGVPLAWRDALGYQCPSCGLYVAIPRSMWATCPRCPGIPIDDTATWLLAFAGFDESDRSNAVAALQPLLAALPAPAPAPSVVPEAAVEAGARALRIEELDDTTPPGFAARQWDEGVTNREKPMRLARAVLTAAFPLLTAAPSATREEDR